MNYDLIIKLAKLANNNPNDNEANQAARKVCRLLAEANFNFPAHNGDDSRRRPTPHKQDDWYDFNDIFNEARKAEYDRRAKEAEEARRKRAAEARKREEDIEREQREKAKSDRERARRDKDFQEKWVKYGGVRPPWADW